MKSWIHEIAESYVSGHKPVRRDLKENFVQLNEEQRFGLLSENVLNYLDEQLQNAFGFRIADLTEAQLNTLFTNLLEYKGALAVTLSRGPEQGEKRAERLRKAEELAFKAKRGKPEDDVDAIRGFRAETRVRRAEIGDKLIKNAATGADEETSEYDRSSFRKATHIIDKDTDNLRYAKGND